MKTFLSALLIASCCTASGALGAQDQPAAAAAALPGAIASAESSAPDPARALRPDQLADALRKGGYVIYFRHAATDFTQSDKGMKNYGDCAHQRMLSAQGRRAATAMGQRIRALQLPMSEILASPYCRTLETARLAFLRAEPRNEIREMEGGDYQGLKKLLAAPVAAGANRWMVGHGTPFRAVAGPPHLAEGEAAVLRPEGTRWVVVARVLPDEWPQRKAAP
jgi:phosphohistidine phosphatase SixA